MLELVGVVLQDPERALPFATLKTGGGKGGEGLVFVAEFLAVRKRSSFRSLPGAALRSALGCKNVAAAGGALAVQSFKRRKTKGKACCFLLVACGGERVRLLCLVSVGVGASLRRWFAWASARSLRQNWRWLKLARTQKSGLRSGPKFAKFGAALPFGN